MTSTTINGRPLALPDDPDALLIDVIRDGGLTGTKLVCGSGVCGACTVLLDGTPVVSCLLPAQAAADKSLTTIEGVGAAGLHPVQKAFMAHDALQCGFCTPGFVVEATAFHDSWRATKGAATPSREEIAAALSGHLCRCGAYEGIFRAVAEACSGRFDGIEPIAPRLEARDKVTGLARYTVDIHHDGQLEGVILRAHVAHARITGLDLAPARAIAGVAAVVPLLGDDNMVRFVGAPIAAVAARDRRTALKAIAAISFKPEPLPAVIGLDAARRDDAPVVFEKKDRKRAGNVSEGAGGAPVSWKGNVRGPSAPFSQKAKQAKSWLDEARAQRNPLLVEETFRVSTQQHASLEPHAAVARFDGDQLIVHISTQAIHESMEKIAKRYGLSHDKVRVIADHVGGGFGSKGSVGLETIAAIELARAAKAPVRVAFDREEELSVTGYRPAAELKLSLLPSAEGRLKALSLTAHADTGAAVNSLIAGLARLIYPAEAKELVDFDVLSNLPPGAPFRGPGGPPMSFALEQAVDEAALRMKIDPIDLRKLWDPRSQPPAIVRLGGRPRGLEEPQAGRRADRPLPARRRRRHRLLALSLADRLLGRTRDQGRPHRRKLRGAGYRHGHPQRDRQHRREGVRSRAAGCGRSHRPLQPAPRAGLRRQPRHRLGGAANLARHRQAESGNQALRVSHTCSRLERAVARDDRGFP